MLINKNAELKKCIQKKYLNEIFIDAIGYSGAKIIRRIIGIAHVKDLDGIEDEKIRSECEIVGLRFSREVIVERHRYEGIEDVLKVARKYFE